MNASKAGKNKP